MTDRDAPTDDALLPLYRELRNLAASYLQRAAPGQTLQPTEIVHEAYLRLAGNEQLAWNSKTHFFAISAKAMRHVLLDHVRGAQAQKRGAASWLGHGLAPQPFGDLAIVLQLLAQGADLLDGGLLSRSAGVCLLRARAVRLCVPDANGRISRRRDDLRAVARERHRVHVAVVVG